MKGFENMLKKVLVELKNGDQLVLSWYENTFSEAIEVALIFDSGSWLLEKLNCVSASSQGLGTCACNSHTTYVYEEITREQALDLIKKYIKEELQEQRKKEKEIKFIDNLINSL